VSFTTLVIICGGLLVEETASRVLTNKGGFSHIRY